MNVNNNHQNYKRTIDNGDADTRAAVEARLSEAHAAYGVEQLQGRVQFDIRSDSSRSSEDTMYPTEEPNEWLHSRDRPRLNTNDIYQRNPANYEYNEDEDINYHSYREPNEEDNYNDYNFDGRKSSVTNNAVNTWYSENNRNIDNLITHYQDGATHRDVKVNWNETKASDSKASSSKNKYAEKTTYCRPVFNVYRQDYIYEAIERNAKLQMLLKKLVIARRKEKEEKERGEWNNYVNKLKNTGHYLSKESRHIEPRHMESRLTETRHVESRQIEPRHNEPRARVFFERSNQSHEFTHNPNSEVIYDAPYRSLYKNKQQHTEPPRFNNHPEHKRVPVRPGFESGHENKSSFSITSSIDRLLTLAKVWQSSTPHTITEDRPKSPLRIPVESDKYEECKGYCEKCPVAIKKEDESLRETNPANTTGDLCKTCPLANRKEEISRETNPTTTTGCCCKIRFLASRKEESSREKYPANTTGGHLKSSLVPGRKEEESSQETYPATTTGGYCKACLLAGRKEEENSRKTYPASSTGGYCKACLLAGIKEDESSRETYPAPTTGGLCKTCPLASMNEEETLRETYPATTTGGLCKTCPLANRKEESLRETNPATTTGGHLKMSLFPGRKEEESLRETYPANTTNGYCKACVIASRKEESSRETYPATIMDGHFNTCVLPGRKEEESLREAYPATNTSGYCKACLLASRKEESLRESYPATTTGGYCKACLLASKKEEESSREPYPATPTVGLCKTCPLASMNKEESPRNTYPASTTGGLCKTCPLGNRREESSRETYPATITGGHFKTCLLPGRKEEESLREIYSANTASGYCKACLLASRKEESSRETYPVTTAGGYCKACLLANMKEEDSSREIYPATTTGGYCKACLLANMKEEKSSKETYPTSNTIGHCKACLLASRKEESSWEPYPATTTGGYCKACLLSGTKEEESSREKYPAPTTGGSCKACPHTSRKEEEISRETNTSRTTSVTIDVATQSTSIPTNNIEVILTDQMATKNKYEELTRNVNRLKNLIDLQDQEKQRRNSLSGIQTKIDSLENSINTILSKLESVRKVSASTTGRVSCVDEFRNMAKSTTGSGENAVHEVENIPNNKNTVCDCDVSVGEPANRPEQPGFPEKPRHPEQPELPEKPERSGHSVDTFNLQTEHVVRPHPTKYRNISSSTSKIDKIMCEELVKSNQLRKDIEQILCQSNSSCAVQISFDIPTRERCTEVTDSLSKAKLMEEQEISIQELSLSGDRNPQMTIAVNTDPLGLLAWFRMSSDTLKQLISYVPYVDYSRYLLRAPLPQITTAAVDYVCNICGACFTRPSLLNDHIRTHELTNSKNCCICHHVLNIKPQSARSVARFACRYCGQRFTRAYCCELHEQSCARSMGRNHDVRSGHGLLR